MPQCAWASTQHKGEAKIPDGDTIFQLGDPAQGIDDVPSMELKLCRSCAEIYRRRENVFDARKSSQTESRNSCFFQKRKSIEKFSITYDSIFPIVSLAGFNL